MVTVSVLFAVGCEASIVTEVAAKHGVVLTSEQASAIAASFKARPLPTGGLSDAQLARLARCESGGNPRVVSASGKYHGLYQFDQRTWNGVARRVAPEWVGVRPSAAPPEVQNAMARQLYRERGRSPWPACGRRM